MLSCILLISFLPALREGAPHLADFIPTTLGTFSPKVRYVCPKRQTIVCPLYNFIKSMQEKMYVPNKFLSSIQLYIEEAMKNVCPKHSLAPEGRAGGAVGVQSASSKELGKELYYFFSI